MQTHGTVCLSRDRIGGPVHEGRGSRIHGVRIYLKDSEKHIQIGGCRIMDEGCRMKFVGCRVWGIESSSRGRGVD